MKISKKLLSLLLAVLMILPMLVIPTGAEASTSAIVQDFEGFANGQTLTTANGFASILPIHKVLEESGNKFIRVPIAATKTGSTDNLKVEPTNRGKIMQFNHAAFSTTQATSITIDVRPHGISGSNIPHIGLWIKTFTYTNTSGAAGTKGDWLRLFEVNLLTGDIIGTQVNGTNTGAKGLTVGEWNTVEVVYSPKTGAFDIYVNDVLYKQCTTYFAGTDFVIPANTVMMAVDNGNNAANYMAVGNLASDYSNANYMDFDNLSIAPAKPKPILNEGFENCTVGSKITTANGFATVGTPFTKVLEENGNKFLRLPIASTSAGSDSAVRTGDTNRGKWITFKHAAFSTTENTSISMDLRYNGVAGSSAPIIGVWIGKLSYTDINGASATKQYVRLFDVNLLTGELSTKDVNGKTTGAKGLVKGEWNHIEVVFEPLTGAFDIYVNDALYKQCTAIVEGTNFAVGANQLWYCVCSSNSYKNYTAASALNDTWSNCNYMDGDNFKIVTTDRQIAGELYYNEGFDSYTPGNKVALGTTPGATSIYATDPLNSKNVAVKVPFGATPNDTEILMRMNGALPVENGFYEVTRNAETNAVELAGWTVTPDGDNTYTITDGTTTYTGLELTTKDTYYAYWGADGTIDQNWQLPNPEINYTKQTSVILSVDYFISLDAYGKILCQMRNYASNGTSAAWMDLFYLDAGAGTIAPKGGTTSKGLNKGEWNNVMVEFDLLSGTGKVYLNGVYVGNGTYAKNLTLTGSRLMVAKQNRKYNDYKKYDGYFMVDNVKLMSSKNTVTVDPNNLLYVEVDGRKIYANSFEVPSGSTYKAVYLKESDYLGILETEASNSIRLFTEAGLRFATQVDTTLLAKLYAYLDAGDLAGIELGTLIAPADYISTDLSVAALDQAGKNYLTIETDRDGYFNYDQSDDTTHFVGSIVNLYKSNITRDFAGRGYAKITFRSGQVVWIYSSFTQVANVKDVATRVLQLTDYVATLSPYKKNILDTYAAGNAVAVPEELEHIRKLDGLNVLAFGDSLFHGDAVGYSEQWIARLARRHAWNLTNLGRNGWTLAYNPDVSTRASIYNYLMNNKDFVYGTANSNYYNYGYSQKLSAADVDVILLEGGTNDYGSNIPMGTVDSKDCGTLMGATNLIVEKLLETYQNATVVLVTSWHVSGTKTIDGATASRLDYTANSMKQLYVANYSSNPRVTIVDAGNPKVTGVDMNDAAFRAKYSIAPNDANHLNVEGMKIMEQAMPKVLADALFVCDAVDGISTSHSYEGYECTKCGYVDPLSVKEEGITRVVCVGDSITAGGYWKNNLQGNLDASYEVLGFGVSGSTGLASGFDSVKMPKAYVNQPEYAESLRYNADIVVVMLGTNDTKGYNYNRILADNGVQYKKDMIRLIEGYKTLNPDTQIFLGLPATIFRAWTENGINNEALEETLIDLLIEIAAETGATVVDVHAATKDAGAHFSDGVHPSDDTGRALIAKAFADAILKAEQ